MSDAWERLCESVGETPETVFAGYTLVTEATPATGGQSAGETRAKEGRSTEVSHGDGQQ